MPFEPELSERLIAAIGSIENQRSADIPAIIDELGVDRNDPEFGHLAGVAANKAELARNLATHLATREGRLLEDRLPAAIEVPGGLGALAPRISFDRCTTHCHCPLDCDGSL